MMTDIIELVQPLAPGRIYLQLSNEPIPYEEAIKCKVSWERGCEYDVEYVLASKAQAALAHNEADKVDIIRQCAEIAHEYNRSGKQAWLDKYGDVRLVDAMMTILKKE
jgi:hypothetical protein